MPSEPFENSTLGTSFKVFFEHFMNAIEDLRHASELLHDQESLEQVSHQVSRLELDMQILKEHLDQEVNLLPKVEELKVLAQCQTDYLRRLQEFVDDALPDLAVPPASSPQVVTSSAVQSPASVSLRSAASPRPPPDWTPAGTPQRQPPHSARGSKRKARERVETSTPVQSPGMVRRSNAKSVDRSGDRNSGEHVLTETNRDRLRYLKQLAANRARTPSTGTSSPLSSPRRTPSNPLRRSLSSSAVLAMRQPPRIPHMTQEELRQIPQYLRGRNSVDRVNEVVDIINATIAEKYIIMRMRQTEMSNMQLKKWKQWTRQEPVTAPGSATSGGSSSSASTQFFFVDKDITEHKNFRMDASGKAVIHVLRHTCRIKEVRDAKGITRYFIQDVQKMKDDSDVK